MHILLFNWFAHWLIHQAKHGHVLIVDGDLTDTQAHSLPGTVYIASLQHGLVVGLLTKFSKTHLPFGRVASVEDVENVMKELQIAMSDANDNHLDNRDK